MICFWSSIRNHCQINKGIKLNPPQQLPYQVEEKLITMSVPWVSALSQNTVWQWPDLSHILLLKKRTAGSLDQPRTWNCSECLWWSTSRTLSRIEGRGKSNCLHWGLGHICSWISSISLSITLSRRDKSSIQVMPSTHLLSLCLNQTEPTAVLVPSVSVKVRRALGQAYPDVAPWSLFNTLGSTL